jgi:hypothetical protein
MWFHPSDFIISQDSFAAGIGNSQDENKPHRLAQDCQILGLFRRIWQSCAARIGSLARLAAAILKMKNKPHWLAQDCQSLGQPEWDRWLAWPCPTLHTTRFTSNALHFTKKGVKLSWNAPPPGGSGSLPAQAAFIPPGTGPLPGGIRSRAVEP